MECARCGEPFTPGRSCFREATVWIRDRDGGGPNRRDITPTGRVLCQNCSLRMEYGLSSQQTELFPR